MKPSGTVRMSTHGDYAKGYIGTETASTQGGYEVRASRSNTAPHVENVLMYAIKSLLSDQP